jgi:simple sugar transport system substrate-binding protein
MVAAVVAGCGGTSSNSASGGGTATLAAASTGGGTAASSGAPVKVIVVTHAPPGDAYWATVQKGATDAAKDFHVSLQFETLATDAVAGVEARNVEAAIAQKPDGIALTIPDTNAMKGAIKDADAAGIPLVALNVGGTNPSDWQSLGIPTFVGFDPVLAGDIAGQQMVSHGVKDAICVNQAQGVLLLEEMCGAFAKTVEAGGGKAKMLVVPGTDVTSMQADITGALSNDKNINGIMGLGPASQPAIQAAMAASGRASQITQGSLALNGGILQDVINGKAAFTLDQMGYMQGYLPVEFLAMKKRLGIMPLGHVDTGPILITKGPAADQALKLSQENIR